MTSKATLKRALRDNLSDQNTTVGRLAIAVGDTPQKDIAARAGISVKTLQRYLAGKGLRRPNLTAIAAACGVSPDWLIGGSAAMESELSRNSAVTATDPSGQPNSRTEHYVSIPRYNIQASAGGGALAEHAQVVEYLAFDVDFVRTRLRRDPKYLVLIEARGDSMEPTIRDGDILTVDLTPDQPLAHSHLYILRVDNDLMVKRLERRLDGALIVSSDNIRYKAETVERERLNTLHILGQVLLVSAPPR